MPEESRPVTTEARIRPLRPSDFAPVIAVIDEWWGGRAMAGINGNLSARIYCQKIEAELLAIDGYYRTAEEIDAAAYHGPTQVWLEGDVVQITPLN